jgi:antagonist of KipI
VTAVLEVLEPGLLTSVQDHGRPGLGAIGVSRGGAADPRSLAVANAVLGNGAGDAGLEMTLVGPALRVLVTLSVGLGGCLAGRVLETGEQLRPGAAILLAAGSTLVFDPPVRGARGYLAVPGGIDVPIVLGSRSTALGTGFGGLDGRPLRVGDRLAAFAGGAALVRPSGRWTGPVTTVDRPLRILPGPTARDAASEVLRTLVTERWTVDPASDRVGARLSGPLLSGAEGSGQLASHGVVEGTIQLPPDGRPIILLADHQPTGGYPVIAVVASADLPSAGQLAPGAGVRFELVDEAAAREALRAERVAVAAALADLHEARQWDALWQGAGG